MKRRTLVYKRTHTGDPDSAGRFGIRDCMGTVRNRDFDAVIGVGGIGGEAKAARIDRKVNWIGIGPRKMHQPERRGPLVTFDHFILFDEGGPDFREIAPTLARHIYSRNVRVVSNFSKVEQAEIDRLLRMASAAPPSAGKRLQSIKRRCPKCCPLISSA